MPRHALAATVAFAFAMPPCLVPACAQTPAGTLATPEASRQTRPDPDSEISEALGRAPEVRVAPDGSVVVAGRTLPGVGDAVGAGVLALPPSAGAVVFVAHRDASVSVWDAQAGPHDPRQTIAGLGRGLADLAVDPLLGRVLVLAAGSAELFSIQLHDPIASDQPAESQADPAYIDHARACDFLDEGERARAIAVAANPALTPSGAAQPPTVLLLATDRRVLVLALADRSYRVLEQRPLPDGLARVEALAAGGGRWYVAAWTRSGRPKLLALAPHAPEDPPADLTPTLAGRLTEAAGLGREPNWLVHQLRRDGEGLLVDVQGEWPATLRPPDFAIISSEPESHPVRRPAPPGSP